MQEAARAPAPRHRGLKVALVVIAIVAVAIAGLIGFALSDRGLSYIASRVASHSGGRISVERPSGSLAGTMRFGRITWHGEDATLVADDVIVDWKPGALLGRHLLVRGLGARKVALSIKPSSNGAPSSPPTNLQLPLDVDIDRLAIGEFDWQAGPRSGHISGLELGYSADRNEHRIRNLTLVSDYGRLTGNVTVGAKAPLDVQGTIALEGAGTIEGAHADITLAGPLATLAVNAKGAWRDTSLALAATATPFANTPFSEAKADLTNLDAKAFDASLPTTHANVRLAFAPRGAGVAGSFEALNDAAGPIDTGRVPFSRIAAKFALDLPVLDLSDMALTVADGGEARGKGSVTLSGASRGVTVDVDVSKLDLARLDTKLVQTNLGGKIRADANAERQAIRGDVRERDMALTFDAVVDASRVDVREFRASKGGGSLAGSATIARNDANDFTLKARAAHLDPSRFAALPAASLDATIDAKGTLHPALRVAGNVDVAPTSRVRDVAVSGSVQGTFTRESAENVALDLHAGSAHVKASGAAGRPGDRLAIDVDAQKLADLAPLLPASLPQPLTGSLAATGHLALGGNSIGGDLSWHARTLHAGDYRVGTLEGEASIAPAQTATLDSRAVTLRIAATDLVAGSHTAGALDVSASGSLARHHATLTARGQGQDISLALDGTVRHADTPARAEWNGTLVSFANRGTVPLRLVDPAQLTLRAHYVRLADARFEVADGRASVGEFAWNEGRITTKGSFTHIPLTSASRLAGRTLPLESTLVLGGQWSIVASPGLNGTFSVKRESGDLFADIPTSDTTTRQAAGISTLALDGTFRNDALDAQLSFVSARAGIVKGHATIGAVAGAPAGTIDPRAPLALAVKGDLPSLAVFQPLFGTTLAVDGRASLDVAASGTVGMPLWTGAVEGRDLRVTAPQFGVYVTDGVLRAHLARNGIALDALHFAGGDGTLDASGLIALPGAKGAATRVTWKADRFRVANRPDLRFVVDGGGAIELEQQHLALTGALKVVEGHVEYQSQPTGKLASDIVIEGEPRKVSTTTNARAPLALDVTVDLGDHLTFVGEGLDARLTGRLHITTNANGNVQANGTIRTVNGTYYAFGQKLTIDRGRVIFDGPIGNPALDVVALRKNLPVEAGVEISGTVKVPQVRVTSNPPVPENEALAWLVTGQGLNSGGRIDYGALGAASAALLGRNGKPITARIAQSIGLDEISLQSSSSAPSSGTQSTVNQVVVFGKRISDRLSLGYEQGLSLATSAVRLEYALTRQITIRAEAGTTSGVSIVYRRSFR